MGMFIKVTKDGEEIRFGRLIGAILIVIGVLIAALAIGIPNYGRWNRLQNENNQTRINDIMIAQTQQLVKVEQQKAQIRIVDAQGLAKSQQIIAGSLTNQYLQYEAIEAQKAEINSSNHTVIYVPSGNNGIPFVNNVSPQQ